MFATNGILFNHESPRRGETFVTRKITRAATRIKLGLQKKLYLGNLDAKRDWGYAKDYVEGMWRMLQHDSPTILFWPRGKPKQSANSWITRLSTWIWTGTSYVEIDPRYFRPTEVNLLLGDSCKAKEKLGWTAKTSCKELAELMVDHDLELRAMSCPSRSQASKYWSTPNLCFRVASNSRNHSAFSSPVVFFPHFEH